MKQEDAEHGVAIDAPKGGMLPLGHHNQAKDEHQKEQQHSRGAYEALLLTHGAEDEVGVLLGHVLQLGLRAVEEPLAVQTARTDGYLRLVDVIPRPCQVLLHTEHHLDANLLMGLEHTVEEVVARVEEAYRAGHEEGDEQVVEVTLAQGQQAEVA